MIADDILETLLDAPFSGAALTLGVYALAVRMHAAMNRSPLSHPVLISIVAVGSLLIATGADYEAYFTSAEVLHLALGPLLVLLAVPFFRQMSDVRAAAGVIGAALPIGCATALLVNAGLASALSGDPAVVASLVPRSTTTAAAVGISESLGGVVSMTAAVVIATGVFGAVVGPSLLTRCGVCDDRAVGLALGVAAHAIGTARAFQISPRAGAFAGIGMVLNALLTLALAPVAMALLA